MKRLGSIALLSAPMVALGALIAAPALVGCENASRLDKAPASAERGAAAAPMPIKADHSGSVEDRLTRLENNLARYGDTLEWVNGIHEQQKQQAKAQAEQQRREEPDPDAVFAVDIAPDLKLGQIEGPAGAPVTIVEAWDFA